MFDAELFSALFDTFSDIACSLSPKDTGGPVVTTGPTRGQNRSRNQNGRWRKKRRDTGVPRKMV